MNCFPPVGAAGRRTGAYISTVIQEMLRLSKIGLILIVAAAGYGASAQSSFYKDHCLFIERGYLKQESPTPEQILSRSDQLSPDKPLVIHFHGGLVTEETAKREATDLTRTCYGDISYPVFFVWNAGFWTQLSNTLEWRYQNVAFLQGHLSTAIFLERLYNGLKPEGIGLNKAKANAGALLTAYRSYMSHNTSFQSAVAKQARVAANAAQDGWRQWGNPAHWGAAKDAIQHRVTDYFSPFVQDVVKYHDSGSVSWSGDLLEWASSNLGGKDIWTRMKKDTSDAFFIRNGRQGAGIQFLQALALRPNRRVVLIGHSTGCIYIQHFLEAAHRMLPGRKFDVVFLAPANTYQDTAAFLKTNADSIGNFRMFGISDSTERKDHMLWQINPQFEGLYPGSLLYYVSRAVERRHNEPILGLQRDFAIPASGQDREASLYVHEHLFTSPRSAVWSPTKGQPGLACACTSHGDFCSDGSTQTSLRYLITHTRW